VFLSLYVRLDVLIYSATQLQACLINLLTYLLTYLRSVCKCTVGEKRQKSSPRRFAHFNSVSCHSNLIQVTLYVHALLNVRSFYYITATKSLDG